jgi:hypothetical protein
VIVGVGSSSSSSSSNICVKNISWLFCTPHQHKVELNRFLQHRTQLSCAKRWP